MLGANKMSTQVEHIGECSMGNHKSLRLPGRLESPHTPFPDPSRLMGLLSTIILILLSAVDRLRRFL